MAYYSRHTIFLHDNDTQKLLLIQSLLNEEELSFVIQEETVYQYDGEPLTVPCISDVNWNYGDGYVWYNFETDMERISEKFNRQYPEDTIIVYVKTEDGFENLYEFCNGSLISNDEVIHYQVELNKVCEELNLKTPEAPLPLYEVIDIANHPTVLFHYGAYTFIGYYWCPLKLWIFVRVRACAHTSKNQAGFLSKSAFLIYFVVAKPKIG